MNSRTTARAILGWGRLPLLAVLLVGLLLPVGRSTAANSILFEAASTTPTTSGVSTTLQISSPAGIEAGDFLLAQIAFEKGSDVTAITAPAGWTLEVRTNQINNIGQAVYYKFATASDEAASDFTWSFSISVKSAGGILRYSGVDTADPVIDTQANSGENGNVVVGQSVQGQPDSTLLALFAVKKNTTLSTPSGMQARMTHLNTDDVRVLAADQAITSSGGTGSRTSVPDISDKWVAHLILLRSGSPAPVVTPPGGVGGDPQTADEGEDKAFNLGSFSDPDSAGDWDVTVDWGDSSPPDEFSQSSDGSLGTLNHTYADDGTYSATAEICDEQANCASADFDITVANVAPVVTAPAGQEAGEALATGIDLGSFTDPGADANWTVDIDWGDTTTSTLSANTTGSLGSPSHTYTDEGVYNVTVQVTDKDGASDDASFAVTVDNAAPSYTPPSDGGGGGGDPQTAEEGESKAFALGSFADPGAGNNPWQVDISWGDTTTGTFSANTAGSLGTLSHTFADNGTYTVTVQITDNDGASHQDAFAVTVTNAAPVVTAGADQAAVEGESTSIALGSFSDAGVNDDPWSVDVDWGDGESSDFDAASQGSLGSLNHTYAAAGPYTVTVRVTDKDGDFDEVTLDMTVASAVEYVYYFPIILR